MNLYQAFLLGDVAAYEAADEKIKALHQKKNDEAIRTNGGWLYKQGPDGYALYSLNGRKWRVSASITNDKLKFMEIL